MRLADPPVGMKTPNASGFAKPPIVAVTVFDVGSMTLTSFELVIVMNYPKAIKAFYMYWRRGSARSSAAASARSGSRYWTAAWPSAARELALQSSVKSRRRYERGSSPALTMRVGP